MTHLAIDAPATSRPTILVVHKDGRRRIENDKEVFEELRRRFGAEASVQFYDAGVISKEPLKIKVTHIHCLICNKTAYSLQHHQ